MPYFVAIKFNNTPSSIHIYDTIEAANTHARGLTDEFVAEVYEGSVDNRALDNRRTKALITQALTLHEGNLKRKLRKILTNKQFKYFFGDD